MRNPRHTTALAALVAALAFPLGVVASHGFTDVPTTSTFHDDIDAIADAGVTTGCAVGKYCPKDFVTREQMAAFLNRLGALAPGKTPVVNADRLDGLDAGSLTRFAYAGFDDTTTITTGFVTYGTVTITAPTDGFVLVNSTVSIRTYMSCTTNCYVEVTVGHVERGARSMYSNVIVTEAFETTGTTTVFEVSAGTNTFNLILHRDGGDGVLQGYWGEMTAQFSPFAEGDVAPAGVTGADDAPVK